MNKKTSHSIIENILLKFPKFSNRIFNYTSRNKLGKFIDQLKKNKIDIKYVYDIGANVGEWSSFYKKTSLKNSFFYLFEANESHREILEKKNFNFFIETLSDKIKIVDFYNNNNSTGDSYFKESTGEHDNLSTQKIKTTTLNELVINNNLPLPDLIKIDTQGAEIDILKGATKILENCKLLYLECPIFENFNKNNLNILDYIKHLKELGFIPQDINQIHHYGGFLVQLDVLFIKKELHQKLGSNPSLLKSLYLAK
jgi:FkbM family methyltransferase